MLPVRGSQSQKTGFAPQLLDRVRGRDVRLRGDDHLVAGPEVERQVGEVQRGHAGRGGDRVRRAGELGEGRLELLAPAGRG